MLFLFLCIHLSLNKGFELENLLIPQTVNFPMKCFRRAEPLQKSPSGAFAPFFQVITALRDDSGYGDTVEKWPIGCAGGARASWAPSVLSVSSFKNRRPWVVDGGSTTL